MICLEEKHTCSLSPPHCCWRILHSRTMGRRKDERQMLHLSLGHSLVKQWSLQFPGLSNILGTSGIIPSQVLCLTALRWIISHRIILWLPGQVLHWFPMRQHWRTPGIKGRREEEKNNIYTFSLFSFSPIFYPGLLSCAHSALHFTSQVDISLHHCLTWIQSAGLQSRNKINCSKF